MLLGGYRDEMSPDAVKAFQDLAARATPPHTALDDEVKIMREALLDIRAHCDIQPSPLAKAIVATCDNALLTRPKDRGKD